MQKLIIKGKKKLFGSIDISGSKNATLPILAATLLTDKAVTLKNIPLVQDVYTMINLLKFIGLNIKSKSFPTWRMCYWCKACKFTSICLGKTWC